MLWLQGVPRFLCALVVPAGNVLAEIELLMRPVSYGISVPMDLN